MGVICSAKPFLKWAGGKTQLLGEIQKFYPQKIERYCEPFVGGGAVLFDIIEKFNPKEILINDINPELTNCYEQIKNNVDDLILILSQWQAEYQNSSEEKRKEIFYERREQFNDLIENKNALQNLNCQLSTFNSQLYKAALMIYLNKTCFNGLYRVNSKGLFNVPSGVYKNPTICNEENLKAVNAALQNVKITTGDYSTTKKFINKNTFVYIDPPYRPLSQTAAFTAYAKNGFGDNEQLALGKFVDEIHAKGAKVVLSNSDPKNENASDNFFDDLYKKYRIHRVNASRMINSNAAGRGEISELLICNFNAMEKMTAEELFLTKEYQEIFQDAIGDYKTDKYAINRYKKDIAKTANYKDGYFYHATGGFGESGIGKGLYLGKDKNALNNFYNLDGEEGEILTFFGNPKFLDLTKMQDFDEFEKSAIKKFSKDFEKNYMKKYTLELGFDGIRYFDPLATGEEFVLYNTDKVKQIFLGD